MAKLDLKYGRTLIPFEYDEDRFRVLVPDEKERALSDAQIGDALSRPIESAVLEEIVHPGQRVLLVIPDATRQSGCAQIINLVVRRLIANGSVPGDINIIFATGIHRRVTENEKLELLTPFIAQRIKTIEHDASDAIRNFRVGETSGGIPVELNWTLTEFDHIVLVGAVSFHYFAGFTGGRKLICPGLASAKTIEATHRLAFDFEKKDRKDGVGTALLEGNAVHEAFVEATALINPSFAINATVNDEGEITNVYCGHWRSSHLEACRRYDDDHTFTINERRGLVIASCGGFPLDINMIQAHKTLDAASHACKEGGKIVLLAECEDGTGRSNFLDWFDSQDSGSLAKRLCENYQVNGQTAWSLLRKAERFDVRIVTSLPSEQTAKMRLQKVDSIDEALNGIYSNTEAYILPLGSKIRIEQLEAEAISPV